MPFKTKLTPNYMMDWGRKYEKASYPVREKHEVELFDIREYVKEMKKQKMAEMMGANGGEGGAAMNPYQGGMGNPLFSANPFAINNPFASPRMSQKNDNDGFNVDDLVKRIDAKIAELEEEERKEKEEEERQQKMARGNRTGAMVSNEPVKAPETVQNIEIKDDDEEPLFVDNSESIIVEEPKVDKLNINELDKSNNKLNIEDENDDNFFDDFFYDEQ